MRTLALIFLCASLSFAQKKMLVKHAEAPAPPPSIARVASQQTGAYYVGDTTIAYPGSVTSGNTIVIGVWMIDVGGSPSVTVTKSSGDATVGSFTVDKTYNPFAEGRLSIISAPVTGSGSLTLNIASNGEYCAAGITEYTNLTQVDGTPTQSSGTSTTYTTGNVAATENGAVFAVLTDFGDGTGNPSYSLSDVLVYKYEVQTGLPGVTQDKLITTTGNHTLTVTNTQSREYYTIAVAYE